MNGASGGVTSFSGLFGTATAGDATIINNGGNVSGASGGKTSFEGFFEIVSPGRNFFGSSTAGNATIINNGGDVSGAGGGETVSSPISTPPIPLAHRLLAMPPSSPTAGRGAVKVGTILFKDFSTGGTSRIEVFGNGRLDISPHNAPGVTIGSIEGSGNVFLGGNNLTVGSKNLIATFSGVIQDGGANAGSGGSVTKIGLGTMVLAGANTYTGNTNINSGVLQVDGSIIATRLSITAARSQGRERSLGMLLITAVARSAREMRRHANRQQLHANER